MKIPLFFNNTARSARAGRFRRWLDRHRDFFDVIEPESREDMLNHLVSQANSGAPAVAVAGETERWESRQGLSAIRKRCWPPSVRVP